MFDDNYTLNTLEVQIPTTAEIFPSNIAVEYTTDYGATWQSLPKYYYLYDYAKGNFTVKVETKEVNGRYETHYTTPVGHINNCFYFENGAMYTKKHLLEEAEDFQVHAGVVESLPAATRAITGNGVNVLAMGAFYVAPQTACDIADAYLGNELGSGWEWWHNFYEFHKLAIDELEAFNYEEFKANGFKVNKLGDYDLTLDFDKKPE